MKLQLRTTGDIQVLTVSELQTPENMKVLAAGIGKLLKIGKNRIILELGAAGEIAPANLLVLGKLRKLAADLAGDIVLAGQKVMVKPGTEAADGVPRFPTTDEALKHFARMAPAAAIKGAGPGAGPTKDPTEAFQVEIKALKDRIRQLESGELGQLRKDYEKLRAENDGLMELIAKRLMERREPPDVAAYQEKIQKLEEQVAALAEASPAPAGAPAT